MFATFLIPHPELVTDEEPPIYQEFLACLQPTSKGTPTCQACFEATEQASTLLTTQANIDKFIELNGHQKIFEYLLDDHVYAQVCTLVLNPKSIQPADIEHASFLKTCMKIVYTLSGSANFELNEYFEDATWLDEGGPINTQHDIFLLFKTLFFLEIEKREKADVFFKGEYK